jgi:UDP-glucose 4-epimerase
VNVLVTGGAGYIGSVVCEFLEMQGHFAVVIDDLRDGNKEAVPKGFPLHVTSCGNSELLTEVFSRYSIDAVFHLAAMANVPDSVRNPLSYYDANVADSIQLLRAMNSSGVDKVVFSSTAAVYGEPVKLPIDEDHSCKPVNPYGHSKLMDERILSDCAVAYGIKHVIFRYFCAAGATPDHGESRREETHLIPVVIDAALGKRREVEVFGVDFSTKDGSGVRDYVHVSDIARAHLLALGAIDSNPNQLFNLGTGEGYSVHEVITIAGRTLGRSVPHKIARRRDGDPAILVASFDKAKRELGWTPTLGLSDIIKSAYEWRCHPLY